MSDFKSRFRSTPMWREEEDGLLENVWKRYYEDLSDGERATLLMWIRMYLKPIQSTNWHCDSDVIKDLFEGSLNGFTLTLDMVRGGMLESGYTPHDPRRKQWYYNVSKRALAVAQKCNGRGV